MADTPSQPPGWPYNQEPSGNTTPPPAPPASYPPAPSPSPYEPPVPGAPPAPGAPQAAAPYAQPGYPSQPPQYGGPGQPPAPTWGAPAAPKKSRRSLWITLGVIFGVLVLAIGACSFWFVRTVTAPVDTSNDFLAAIDRGDYDGAIAFTDPACSQGLSAAELAGVFQGADIDYNLNNSSVTNNGATVSGSFSMTGESVSQIELFLRNNDGWSVCGFDAN